MILAAWLVALTHIFKGSDHHIPQDPEKYSLRKKSEIQGF